MTIFYKKLEFRDVEQITAELLSIAREFNPEQFVSKKFDTQLLEQRVPSLTKQFKELGIEIDVFREFVSQPFRGLGIHQDGAVGYPKKYAINWPIENCKGAYMCWWNFNGDPEVSIASTDPTANQPSIFYSAHNASKVEQVELVTPTLVNIENFHSVENNINSVRRMISFRFVTEPEHLIKVFAPMVELVDTLVLEASA